jgi:diguanylate cyclase (GGDEF)-like protein
MDHQLEKRTDIDFLRRSLPGVAVYTFVWPALAWFMDFYHREPLVSNLFTWIFVGISALRLTHAYYTEQVYDKYTKLWRVTLLGLSYGHAITLSSLLIVMLLTPRFDEYVMATAIITVGLVSGAVASLIPKPVFTQIYIAILVVPAIVISAFHPKFGYLLPLFLILWMYYIFMGRRFSSEYQRAFHIETKLKDQQKKLEQLNITDTLTGIYNRQFFDNAMDLQWDVAARSQSSISLLFLDLDFFKRVNDEYGHLIGDKALCHAAKVFNDVTKRKTDMIARYGGEEFAIILAGTAANDAKELAEQIRQHLQECPLNIGEKQLQLTTSIGVNSVIPNNQISYVDFIDQADQALYEAKKRGRNCVVSYPDTINEN